MKKPAATATKQPDPDSVEGRRKLFIRSLAEYMAGDQVRKSIALGMGDPAAREWSKLRGLTPLFGYPSVDEAETVLTKFLRGE